MLTEIGAATGQALSARPSTTPASRDGAEHLWQLAHDYQRWGLTGEAEIALYLYRQAVIDGLLALASEVAHPDASLGTRPTES